MTFTGRQSRRWSNRGALNNVEENGKHSQHWINYFESHSYISCIYFFFLFPNCFFHGRGKGWGGWVQHSCVRIARDGLIVLWSWVQLFLPAFGWICPQLLQIQLLGCVL